MLVEVQQLSILCGDHYVALRGPLAELTVFTVNNVFFAASQLLRVLTATRSVVILLLGEPVELPV